MQQNQTYPARTLITPGVPSRAAAARPIPAVLSWLVALAVGSSFYVAIEPAPTDLIFLLLFIVVLFRRGVRFPLDLNPLLGGGVLLFIAGSVVSLFGSETTGMSALYLSVTLYLVVSWYVVVILLANYGAPMGELIVRAFLVAATIGALIGLISHFSTVLQDYLYLQSPYGERARGTFKDPNVYAPFLCAALLLVINRTITRGFSLLWIALLCLFALEILAAFSRGAYGNLAVSLAVFFALQLIFIRRQTWLVRSLVLFLVAAVVIVPVAILFLQTTDLVHFLMDRLQLQNYDAQRFGAHSLALKTITEEPFGIGPGQSPVVFPLGTHNLYLQIAVENGVLSICAFLLFIIFTLWVSIRGVTRRGPYQDVYACATAVLIGILVNSSVIDTLHWRHFFLFLAIPIGLWHNELWASRVAPQTTDRARWARI